MSAEIQPDEVVSFWRHMQERFGTTTVNKADAVEMQIVASVLDALGILDRERFLKSFTTTLGRKIYTPFEAGRANDAWDLWDQMVVCVHEHQHVVQHDREGLSFEVSYVADRAARARFEAEAYHSNLEMHFWRYGTTTRSRPLAELLHDYGCRPEDVEIAAHSLALANVSVRRGAVLNESTRAALDWLEKHVDWLHAHLSASERAKDNAT